MVNIVHKMHFYKANEFDLFMANIRVKGQLKYFHLLGVLYAKYSLTAYQIWIEAVDSSWDFILSLEWWTLRLFP